MTENKEKKQKNRPADKPSKLHPSPTPSVIGRGDVLFLCAGIALFLSLAIWLFFGEIRTSFTEVGVLAGEAAAVIVHQPENALVTECLVSENDYVREEDLLLKVYPLTMDGGTETLDVMQREARDVLSPVSGFVTEVAVEQWQQVDVSTPLMRVAECPAQTVDRALVYVDLDMVNQIEIGAEAEIKVEGLSDSYEKLAGTVVSVSRLPVSLENMISRTGSTKTAELLYRDGVEQYLVEIVLDTDPDPKPDSAGKELPESTVICNSICSVTIFMNEIHPYQMLF